MTRYKGHETQGDGYNTTEPSPCVRDRIKK